MGVSDGVEEGLFYGVDLLSVARPEGFDGLPTVAFVLCESFFGFVADPYLVLLFSFYGAGDEVEVSWFFLCVSSCV